MITHWKQTPHSRFWFFTHARTLWTLLHRRSYQSNCRIWTTRRLANLDYSSARTHHLRPGLAPSPALRSSVLISAEPAKPWLAADMRQATLNAISTAHCSSNRHPLRTYLKSGFRSTWVLRPQEALREGFYSFIEPFFIRATLCLRGLWRNVINACVKLPYQGCAGEFRSLRGTRA